MRMRWNDQWSISVRRINSNGMIIWLFKPANMQMCLSDKSNHCGMNSSRQIYGDWPRAFPNTSSWRNRQAWMPCYERDLWNAFLNRK